MQSVQEQSQPRLTNALTWLMAAACGVAVADIYYVQPLLAEMARAFHVAESAMGVVAMLTQVGYACGMAFFVPLGDIVERKKLTLVMLGFSILAVLLMAAAPVMSVLYIAAFGVGLTSATPQILLPFATHLAEPERRGRVIGIIMCGLLIGVLASRTFSGIVGQAFGWRMVYVAASALLAVTLIAMAVLLPKCPPSADLGYGELFRSLPGLVRKHKPLRDASINGTLMFAAFSVFWTTLAFLLAGSHYRLGPRYAGLLGLVGIFGAVAAALVGKVIDRKGPQLTLMLGMLSANVAYVVFFIAGYYMAGLIAGVIALDLGMQIIQVSNQVRVHSLPPEERSRVNTVYMVSFFLGGAFGSLTGAIAFAHFGWYGACATGVLFHIAAWTYHLLAADCRRLN